MQWIAIVRPVFESIEQFDAVTAQLDGEAVGLEARYAGSASDGKLRVVTLWESKTHADRFFTDRLGPARTKALGPEPVGTPEVVGVEVARSYAR